MIKLFIIAWAIIGVCVYGRLYTSEKLPTKNVLKNRVTYGVLGPIVWGCRLCVIGYDYLVAWLKEEDEPAEEQDRATPDNDEIDF